MNKQLWFGCSWVAAGLLCSCGTSLLGADGSLWGPDARPIVADKRAAKVGDLLTILVQQNSTISKDAKKATSKTSNVDAGISSLLFSPSASSLATQRGKLPALKFDAKSGFSGDGSVNTKETVTDRITVQVIDTQPNGNLVIEGTRQIAFAGETQDVTLRGVVRPADISANNTVFSYNVANATIKMTSKGALADAQRKGWATKLWDKLSPF